MANNFIVITRGRTGSTHLISLLSSHPQIQALGEVFGEYKLRNKEFHTMLNAVGAGQQLDRLLKGAPGKAVGIKLLYYQLEAAYAQEWEVRGLEKIAGILQADPSLKVIHLKRRQKLETLLSLKLASKTSTFHIYSEQDPYKQEKIFLTVEECETEFRKATRWEEYYDAFFGNHPLLEVYYEDLVSRQEEVSSKILRFLSLPEVVLHSNLYKQNKLAAFEAIRNYPELKNAFLGTQWEGYFNTSVDERPQIRLPGSVASPY